MSIEQYNTHHLALRMYALRYVSSSSTAELQSSIASANRFNCKKYNNVKILSKTWRQRHFNYTNTSVF